MKSEQDILYRIFANLAISQRSICECPEFPRRERKVVANKVIAWLEKEQGILEAMDEDEKAMIYKRVGNRDRIVQQAHWCWESEECLLWAIGLVDQIEIPYYSKNTRDLFMEVLLINFILFCLLGMTFFVLNFFYSDDYLYFSFYCVTISLLCGRDYIKKKYL